MRNQRDQSRFRSSPLVTERCLLSVEHHRIDLRKSKSDLFTYLSYPYRKITEDIVVLLRNHDYSLSGMPFFRRRDPKIDEEFEAIVRGSKKYRDRRVR